MAHSTPSKSRRASLSSLWVFAGLGPNLEFEARLILAWLWAPLKRRLEPMLRFGLRSKIATMIIDGSPGQSTSDVLPQRRCVEPAASFAPDLIYAAKRGPKKFLAARRGGE